MRNPLKGLEQMLTENHRNQRTGRSGGHIAEDGGVEKRNGDNGVKRRSGDHGLNGGTDKGEKSKPEEERLSFKGGEAGTEEESGL